MNRREFHKRVAAAFAALAATLTANASDTTPEYQTGAQLSAMCDFSGHEYKSRTEFIRTGEYIRWAGKPYPLSEPYRIHQWFHRGRLFAGSYELCKDGGRLVVVKYTNESDREDFEFLIDTLIEMRRHWGPDIEFRVLPIGHIGMGSKAVLVSEVVAPARLKECRSGHIPKIAFIAGDVRPIE